MGEEACLLSVGSVLIFVAADKDCLIDNLTCLFRPDGQYFVWLIWLGTEPAIMKTGVVGS